MGHADVVDIGKSEAHARVGRVLDDRLVLAAEIARRLGDAIDEIGIEVAHGGPAYLPQKPLRCTQSFAWPTTRTRLQGDANSRCRRAGCSLLEGRQAGPCRGAPATAGRTR